jgi:hypothetical protein
MLEQVRHTSAHSASVRLHTLTPQRSASICVIASSVAPGCSQPEAAQVGGQAGQHDAEGSLPGGLGLQQRDRG